MCDQIVTNLSDIRDREAKILQKQLKLICLLSMRFLKAEAEAEGIELMKKSVMEIFILDRLIFRTLSCITVSDSLLNSKPSYRQPLHKETLSSKPGRVLNSHLTVLNLLFMLLSNIY